MKLSDDELMLLYISGRQEAFMMLYERYRHYIYRLIRYSLKNTADVADCVQETFLRVHRSRETYRPSGQFRAWLSRIAINVVNTFFRGQKVKLQFHGHPFTEETAERGVMQANGELHDEIIRAMQHLHSRYRSALVLREIQGLDYQEVAAILDTSPQNARVMVHRGRKTLRQLLCNNVMSMGDEQDE